PVPWGLVRFGVAPDHPKIKAVTRRYEKTARLDGFRFFGNVEVGRDVSVEELKAHYHAVIYAFGAAGDRKLGIPGEELPGSHSSTEFVAWYNGHPDYCDHEFDLTARTAVVVGNGNVALDVARMLALPRETLAQTDVADHALEALTSSSVEEVVVLGRRGPAQAAFTTPELIELSELAQADVIVDPGDMELDAASARMVEEADAQTKKKIEVLHGYAASEPHGHERRIVLRFYASPLRSSATSASRACASGARSWSSRRTARCARSSPRARRRSPPSSCSAPSATAACRSRGSRSTSAPRRSPTTTAACCQRRAAPSAPASTSPAGSSAVRTGSSARTRRTARTPSTRCSRTPPPASCRSGSSRTATRSRGS